MCGIAGFIDFRQQSGEDVLLKMVDALHHRGPDDRGVEVLHHSNAHIGFGQARLSIIDLSSGGHQPMHWGDLSIVFNGEIYNYQEIRAELVSKGHSFKTQSDTEVILHAVGEWGLEAVHKLIGMFAFVVYDRAKDRITITRDRAGVKPLFYYYEGGTFLFASELKSFHPHPGFKKELNADVLGTYFHYGYVASPDSIFKNAHKLQAGHHLILDLKSGKLTTECYWDIREFYKKDKLLISYEEAKEEVHRLLKSACEYRMVADVPVGVFLSGGFDSTAITSILQKDRTEKLKTFTIGFEEGNNEAPYAKQTADFLGTDHHEYICTTREAQDIIPTLPHFYDEPFADSSAIPTMLVSKIARQSVTVALSADAGDEVFAGYNSYGVLQNNLSTLNRIPDALKPLAGWVGKSAASFISDSKPDLKHKIDGAARALQTNARQQAVDLFRIMNSLPRQYQKHLFAAGFPEQKTAYNLDPEGFQDVREMALAVDYQMYMQNDILVKVDRASMSVSLEGREPLLDQRLVEFAARLPYSYKREGGTGKRILKDIVYQYIPKEMMDRPKTGFTLPIYSWLRGDLSYLIDEYLSERALKQSGLFNVPWVVGQVDLFRKGQLHYKPFIWKVLMFQMWYSKWMS